MTHEFDLLWDFHGVQEKAMKYIEITSWAGGAYRIFARVGDVSEIEQASIASKWNFWYKQRVWKFRTSPLPMK